MGTAHDRKTSKVDHYLSVGAIYKGLFDARPKDDIGIAISEEHVNPAERRHT